MKHAFAGRESGCVRVVLRRIDRNVQLAVRDDGAGFPAGFEPEKTNSLGMRLVKILSGQIKGRMAFNSGAGAEVVIDFDAAGAASRN